LRSKSRKWTFPTISTLIKLSNNSDQKISSLFTYRIWRKVIMLNFKRLTKCSPRKISNGRRNSIKRSSLRDKPYSS
jgi:hypothetical protein